MEKYIWKMLMYKSPAYYFWARSSKSKAAQEAADEYEELLDDIAPAIGIIIGLGVIAFIIWLLFAV